MTIIHKLDMKCGLCGETSSQPILSSTNSMGYSDLDLRPPAMRRDTMNTWVLECPHCGYVASRFEEEAKIKRQFIESDSYMTCDGNEFISGLSRRFYRSYLIAKDKASTREEYFSILYCAWACDDREDPLAVEMRKLAGELAERLLEEEYDENTYIARADHLRRSHQYGRVIEEYADATPENGLISNIIIFQVEKAHLKDDACYTVKDVIDEYGSE